MTLDLKSSDVDFFRRGEWDNPRFWSRLGEKPDVRGLRVLEIGSGWGSLCVDLARAGAERVVGLDLKQNLIEFSRAYVHQHYPELEQRVIFQATDLKDYPVEPFDIVVSKDSFEHILDLGQMLFEIKRRLRPGGKVYVGFGPLYPSPYGDHDRRRTAFKRYGAAGQLVARIPWGHLFLEQPILNLTSQARGKPIHSMYELGLNKRSLSDYRRLFSESGLKVVMFRVNQSGGLSSKMMTTLGRVPGLADYCTNNIYCILQKPS